MSRKRCLLEFLKHKVVKVKYNSFRLLVKNHTKFYDEEIKKISFFVFVFCESYSSFIEDFQVLQKRV